MDTMNTAGEDVHVRILNEVRDEFLKHVDAKAIASDVLDKAIIPEKVETEINDSKSLDGANKVLFVHLRRQAIPEDLLHLCRIMKESTGYRKMQGFGEKLQARLEEAFQEHSTASSEHPSSINLITESDSICDSESTEEKDVRFQRKRRSAMKSKTSAKRRKVLEELHIELEIDVQHLVLSFKRSGQAPDVLLKSLFGIVYTRITEVILHDQLSKLITYVDTQRSMKNEPFASISQEEIQHCNKVHELFALLGFSKAWLNTGNFMNMLAAVQRPARDSAMYCMKVYHSIVREVCREVFLKNLPETFREELKAVKPSSFRSLITVTYKKELKDFNLTDLLENREYLHRLLKVPLDCFEFLKAKSIHSTTVYWVVDAMYTAHAILDIRQCQIFWLLMERGVIDFHIEGATHLSLRGRHVPQLIKNALLKNQNLIELTETFSQQFQAVVALDVTDQPLKSLAEREKHATYKGLMQHLRRRAEIKALFSAQQATSFLPARNQRERLQHIPTLKRGRTDHVARRLSTYDADSDETSSADAVPRSASESSLLALAIKKTSQVDSSKEVTDDEVDYEIADQIVPDYKQPAEEDIDSTSEEDAPDGEAERTNFTMVCNFCLKQQSVELQAKPRGTCRNRNHNKQLVVKSDSEFSAVREKPRVHKLGLCLHLYDCHYGQDCKFAHSQAELRLWQGMCKAEYELCLDCRWATLKNLFRHQCLTGRHNPTVVVYRDEEAKELVTVRYPENLSGMLERKRDYHVRHNAAECSQGKKCSFPHTQVEARIWNYYKSAVGPHSTTLPPTKEHFLQALRKAVPKETIQVQQVAIRRPLQVAPKRQLQYKFDFKQVGPPSKRELERKGYLLEETLTCDNYKNFFGLLVDWEEHEHIEELQSCDGVYKFMPVELTQKSRDEDQPPGFTNAWYGCLIMDTIIADNLRQAATEINLCFKEHGELSIEGMILPLPKFVDRKACLLLGFGKDEDVDGTLEEMPAFLRLHECYDVRVTCKLKHRYFSCLRRALANLSQEVVKRLVPQKHQLQMNTIRLPAIETPYKFEQFTLDKEYQEPACESLLQSPTSAPFLVTGPFGAGKTRLLATSALRLLLVDDRYRILIATHHIQTANEYVKKYFTPDVLSKCANVKVVRIVTKVSQKDSRSCVYKSVDDFKQQKQGSHRKREREDINQYNLIITTFITMLSLRPVLKECEYEFTHILVDEGAQAREPECVAAFSCAGLDTKIVIAGDHLQVGPQVSVLGQKARENGLADSIVTRLHNHYQTKELKSAASKFQAVMLANHRCHASILCLPSSAFYGCNVVSRSDSQLHPDLKQSVHFVCTSLEQWSPECKWDDPNYYTEQAIFEVKIAKYWVIQCIRNWPTVEWGEVDPSSLCVIVPNRLVERLWRNFASKPRWQAKPSEQVGTPKARDDVDVSGVTCTVAYDIQGREYRAIFICTSEPVKQRKQHCTTYDPVKSLCDQYVFNTVITRACSLVVAIGNPFRLMKIEESAQTGDSKSCWLAYLYRCLQCKSLTLSSALNQKRIKVDHKEIEEGQKTLDDIMFKRATQGLRNLSRLPDKTHDTIMEEYNKFFKGKNVELTIERVGGDLAWKFGKEQPVTRPEVKPTETVRCRLQQKSVRECIATPQNPRQKPFIIIGVENRRCAFEGALVEVEEKGHDSIQRYGQVYSVIEQEGMQPQICEVDPLNASVFIPVDQKSPRLINLTHIPRQLLEKPGQKLRQLADDQQRRKGYVICFKPDTLGLDDVPKISDIIPLEVAPLLLFVVHPVCWTLRHQYPLGAVIGTLPKGTSLLYAKKILSIQHLVPDMDDPDSEVTLQGVPQQWVEDHATYNKTIGILSREGHCSLALSVEEEEDGYIVGIHVSNVAESVAHSHEFRNNSFTRWTRIHGQCQGETVYHSVLPEDVIKDRGFSTQHVHASLTLDVSVTAGWQFRELVDLHKAIRFPVEKMQVRHVKWNPVSMVQCDMMLKMTELEEILKALINGKTKVKGKEFNQKVEDSHLLLDDVLKIVSVLYVVAEECCFKRQGHRGYADLKQESVYSTSSSCLEAGRVVHELVTFANHEAAKLIGQTFRNKVLLKVQQAPPEGSLQETAELFSTLLSVDPHLFQWLERPQIHEAVPSEETTATDATGSDERDSTHKQTMFHLLCSLAAKLKPGPKLDFHAARRLFLQLCNHPEFGVLEALIADALPKEEMAVEKSANKAKALQSTSITTLLENPELKHHSLQLAVSPYTFPFDSISDIYVQHMLLSALGQQVREVASADVLRDVARLSNRAVANANNYESCMTALDVAVYAQHSSICVEAYVKAVSGNMRLCYPDQALQNSLSVQVIKISLVTRSSAAESRQYSAKITSLDDDCRMLTKPTYEIKSESQPDRPTLEVFYPEANDLLERHKLHVEYRKPTLSIAQKKWQRARELLEKPGDTTVKEVVSALREEPEHLHEASSKEGEETKRIRLPKSFEKAPFLTFSAPFTFKPCQVVKVWLRTDTTSYILTPRPQVIELNPDVRICLQHTEDAQSCFTQGAAAEHTKLKYSSIDRYVNTWGELILAEAADASVQEAQHLVFTDFPLQFSNFQVPENCFGEEFYEPVGEISAELSKAFLKNRYDLFPFNRGHFVCARYCINLQREPDLLQKYKHCIYPGADNCVRFVLHLVVDSIYNPEGGLVDVEDELFQTNLKVTFKVFGQNARISPMMREVLGEKKENGKQKYCCDELQLIPMVFPLMRIYQRIRRLRVELPQTSEYIALGRVQKLVGTSTEVCSEREIKRLLKEHPNILNLWNKRKALNEIQREALCCALKNRFQLIQGPPGTGKSVTGAHIAYAFAMLNRQRREKLSSSGEKRPPLRCVLYCGPSNVAVDVIVRELHSVVESEGQNDGLRILRIFSRGIEKKSYPGPELIDGLFERHVQEHKTKKKLERYALHHKVHSPESKYGEKLLSMEASFKATHEQNCLASAEDRLAYRQLLLKADKDIIRNGNYDIVLCTSNEAAGSRVRCHIQPLQCIIDEASMTMEPEAMAPVSLSEHVVLIGDHKQLQPVVKSKVAERNGMKKSLFERYAELLEREYEDCPNFCRLLTQYRMVKKICDFPSHKFYDDELETPKETKNVYWEQLKVLWPKKGPMAFCDIIGTEEEDADESLKGSKMNLDEARKAVELVEVIGTLTKVKAKMVVITPYRAQQKCIRDILEDRRLDGGCDVKTIDASQGSESDIVIFSAVRSKPLEDISNLPPKQVDRHWRMENLGFVAEPHHLCVALTRARFGLIILGNKTLLEYDDTWKSLVNHYERCGYVVDPSKFPSKGAKAAARSMPQYSWPEPHSKPKKEGEDDEDEVQQIMLAAAAEALESDLREFLVAEAAEAGQQVSRPA